MLSSEPILVAKDLTKHYGALSILSGVHLEVFPGELLAIMGVSGSGKSTLLHCISGLDEPSSGELLLFGTNLITAKATIKNNLRQTRMGFVYQFHYLMAELSAIENVALALRVAGVSTSIAKTQAAAMLDEVGLAARIHHRPSELSGGERQRVALARALVHSPQIILADEPTGSLDQDNAHKVWALLRSMCKEHNTSMVVVTHDQTLADSCDRQFKLEQGTLASFKAP